VSHSHHEHEPSDPPQVVEVGDRLFAYVQPDGTWWVNNTGFLVGSDAVTAIDTCATERRTRRLLDAVKRVTPAPIRTLVNTHHHGDHTHGNFLVAQATVVAQQRCRELMAEAGVRPIEGVWEPVDWGELELSLPTVTFDDHLTVWVDDLRVELLHPGTPAHTTNDIVAWVPSQRVVYSGDLVFNGGTPFVLMGSVHGALDSVEWLGGLGAEAIVPGHGPVCDPSVLDGLAAYYRFVLDTAEAARAAGEPPLDAARNVDLGPFAELTDSERLVGNLHRAYAELDGAARGAPIDLVAAIGDMIAYNGGRPLRCVA